MDSNSDQYKSLGSVGGAGSSAQPGGFVAGPQIAGKGGVRGDASTGMIGSPKAGGDVRVGGHFGQTTSAAPAASGYAQGDMFAPVGQTSDDGSQPMGSPGHGDARAGGAFGKTSKSSNAGTGFNQGDQFAAVKK